ncbi:GNAT family N-acetyltransferase [Mycoplasmatota bacterium WC44]
MEYLYKINNMEGLKKFNFNNIIWLSTTTHVEMINKFMVENDLFTLKSEFLQECIDNGINYCALIKNERILAMGCVERYSNIYWETADIKVHVRNRNNGYGRIITSFISNYILLHEKVATSYTHENNLPMRRVLEDIGFELMMVEENLIDKHYSQFK